MAVLTVLQRLGLRAGEVARLTLDNIANGPTFVDTYVAQQGQPAGPVTLKMSQIPLTGLREALAMMPTGARWEVVLPADKAYGNTPQSPIGPNQAVVFDVKLVSVK